MKIAGSKARLANLLSTALGIVFVSGLSGEPADSEVRSAVSNGDHLICVNQIGYDSDLPKRFTVPTAIGKRGGIGFEVVRSRDGMEVFRGKVSKGVGDFTRFQPSGNPEEYFIRMEDGEGEVSRSFPFRVGSGVLADLVLKPAVDFMIDARSVVGTHPSACNGFPWRRGQRFSYELPSLALLYMSMPDELEKLKGQIDWEEDKDLVTDPEFRLVRTNRDHWVVRDTIRYYSNNKAPSPDAPDIAKLLHWGAGFLMERHHFISPEEGGIPRRSTEQLAYFLAVWPRLQQWIDPAFYERCRDFTFENWKRCGMLDVLELWSLPEGLETGTGRIGTGHSILANLLLHEVAKREGREDAHIYLGAAVGQAEWVVDNVDWSNPRTTKGHRASEHKTITGLVWLLQNYPDHAPGGLQAKIVQWADIAVSRSNNMWDFRRFDLEAHWSMPKYDEPGNLAGFPACALAASWVVEDEPKARRLREIAVASWDSLFGRNPLNAAAPHRPEFGWAGIDRGWPLGHFSLSTRFDLARGTLTGSAPSSTYPFNPDGTLREGDEDVINGAALNVGLAYLAWNKQRKAAISSSTLENP